MAIAALMGWGGRSTAVLSLVPLLQHACGGHLHETAIASSTTLWLGATQATQTPQS
ncbi:hypothetical protein H6G89_13120 [Oscillatoria sp. FACHB-1407]|uniref:hypothetical protein n=1 Tax=Oscillatoria sp. FACHB-1407 TaxID=2692847 RepID=UPI0016826630|nr:hypothetical protein [Oscillatoria sp. FACHB-1407]MBD2461989.1 hypothetical protein [Oscillatoria sp. FACHB-1407]